ncbi:MAG: hypothetical protein CMK06_11500 [Ponticaulis sp.]|nr:hypothetical protein [Ponticaulis sp.]|tara:strand:- start:9888 stop:11060 length:1173 start_codon:yes stop_codon:yes gene_type:complete
MRLFKSNSVTVDEVEKALMKVLDPHSGKPLPSSQRLDSLVVSPGGDVFAALTATPDTLKDDERLRYEVEQVIQSVRKVGAVNVVLTSHSEHPKPSQPKSQPVPKAPPARKSSPPSPPGAQSAAANLTIPGVGAMIAVASAKGGVGKSTVAINLAIALSKLGLRVGVLDADVYGPSLPTMTDTVEANPSSTPSGKLKPIEAMGLKLMSIGYVSDIDAPMVWRGPVVMSALTQMMKDVDWGELDVLILDTPPGTGDVQLTLAQRMKLSGAIIVSTPQEVALADVRRGVAMFRKTEVPVLGLVENMAWFEDPVSQNRTYLFGEGGARRMAEVLEIPFLGEVPLVQKIREGGDSGQPAAAEDVASAEVFRTLAEGVLERLSKSESKPAPEIIFE